MPKARMYIGGQWVILDCANADTVDNRHVDDTKSGADTTTNNALWTANKIKTLVDSKAPTSHASTATTYGVASTTDYGHVKVADGISVVSGTISADVDTSTITLTGTTPNKKIALNKAYTDGLYEPKGTTHTVAQITDLSATFVGKIVGNATGNIPISNGTMNTNLNAEMLGGKLASAFALASHGTHVTYASVTSSLTSGGTGVIGTSVDLARADHTHTLPAYPTTLPANGGNADTVDNMHANEFVAKTQIKATMTETATGNVLDATIGKTLKELIDTKSDSNHTHTKANITDFAHTHTAGEVTGLHACATTGNAVQLNGKAEGSLSVSYATSCGNADTVDGKHSTDFILASGATSVVKAKSGAGGGNNPNNCGFAFVGDNDSGIFNPSDGILDITANGATQIRVTSDINLQAPTYANNSPSGTMCVKSSIASTGTPSGGKDGDIWVQYS